MSITLRSRQPSSESTKRTADLQYHSLRVRIVLPARRRSLVRVQVHSIRRFRYIQESDGPDLGARFVTGGSLDSQLLVRVAHLEARRRRRLDGDAIVDVELAGSLSVSARSDDDVKVLLAKGLGGHRAAATKGQDGTALDVNRDRRKVDAGKRHGRAVALHGLVGEVIVEDVLGKVDIHRRRVLGGDGGNENGVTVEELEINGVGVRVLGVLEPQAVENRRAVFMSLLDGGVHVVQELIAVGRQLVRGWSKFQRVQRTE